MPIIKGRESLFFEAFPGSDPNADSSSNEALIRQRLDAIPHKLAELPFDPTKPSKELTLGDVFRPWRWTRGQKGPKL
jgi:hypothetical protein